MCLDLVNAVALAVIFGNFAKVCGGQEVKALASSLASVLRRRRGCLLPF